MRAPVHRQPGSLQFFSSFVGADERLQREVFFLAYHLHWAQPHVLELPIGERWAYVRMLTEQLEREQAELERARR